jgi:hypothetical protein
MPVRIREDVALGVKSFPFAFLAKTTAYTATVDDGVLLVSGTTTITLPAINADLRESYIVINTDAALTVTIATPGAETINGGATLTLTSQYDWAILLPDVENGAWYALAKA